MSPRPTFLVILLVSHMRAAQKKCTSNFFLPWNMNHHSIMRPPHFLVIGRLCCLNNQAKDVTCGCIRPSESFQTWAQTALHVFLNPAPLVPGSNCVVLQRICFSDRSVTDMKLCGVLSHFYLDTYVTVFMKYRINSGTHFSISYVYKEVLTNSIVAVIISCM